MIGLDSAECGALLHNMSAPPRSVVKYSGLSGMTTAIDPTGTESSSPLFRRLSTFGTLVRVVLMPGLKGKSATFILRHLAVEPHRESAKQLEALINARADELPLPEGCAVIPATSDHPILWSDTLTALAILSKCSDSIWLRSKQPSLFAGIRRKQVTLLVPPIFAHRLPEVSL